MKKKFYLPGLYSKSEEKFNSELKEEIETVDKIMTPLFHQFIHNSTDFYKENFRELEQCKRREKRLLEFETPNRAKITHEYDIVLFKEFDYDTYHFLFNPIDRLSWLKIRQKGERILIASKGEIKKMVEVMLGSELKHSNNADIFNHIWEEEKRYPCFVKIEKIERMDFLLEAEFFDSIKENEKKCFRKFLSPINIINPFDERSISYVYEPLKGYSSWLYVRAPKNFKISIPKKSLNYNKEKNKIEFHNDKEPDPEINTLTILNKQNEESHTVKMDIEIIIPSSRKVWFWAIYWISMLMVGVLLNSVYVKFCGSIYITNFALQNIDLRIILSLIAGIIATRGWLITEETILKRYSKYLTWALILLVILSVISTI